MGMDAKISAGKQTGEGGSARRERTGSDLASHGVDGPALVAGSDDGCGGIEVRQTTSFIELSIEAGIPQFPLGALFLNFVHFLLPTDYVLSASKL